MTSKNKDVTKTKVVSIVVPVYNEQDCLEPLYKQLTAAMDSMDQECEVILVNDGSRDQSADVMDDLANRDARVTAVHFRRNFGQTAAIMAGIDYSCGDAVVLLDADLQNDPADIPRMIEQLDEGHDVVSGWRKKRHDAALTRLLPSRVANWLISKVSGVRLHDYGCTLKAYRREVLNGVRLYGEMHRFIPIYTHMQGGSVVEVTVNHRPRTIGESKYGLRRIYKVFLDLIVVKFLLSYSVNPIYFFGGFGLTCLGLSAFPIFGALFFKIASSPALHKDFVQTPLPTIAAAMVLVGFLAILQGLLAEVLMRTYFESKQQRAYVVDRVSAAEQPEENNEFGDLLKVLQDINGLNPTRLTEQLQQASAEGVG